MKSWLILILALPVACTGGSTQPGIQVVDSAGTSIVRLTGEPTDTYRLSSPRLRLGSAAVDAPEAVAFVFLSDVVARADGSVVVVDNLGGRVALFDSAGRWVRDYGARGSGPGEHTGPLHASILRDTLWIWDALLRRAVGFDSAGMPAAQLPLPWKTEGHPIRLTRYGIIDEVHSGQLHDPDPARGALVRHERGGTASDTLVGPYQVPEYGWTTGEDGIGHMVNPPALAVGPVWTVSDSLLFLLRPLTAHVEVRDLRRPGPPLQRIEFPRMARPPDDAMRDAFVEGLGERFGIPDAALASIRSETVFTDLVPPLAGLLVDDRGRVWAADLDPAASNYVGFGWTVVDPLEELVVRVEFPRGFRLLSIRAGRGFGVTTDADGVNVVDVFVLPEERPRPPLSP